MKLCAGQIDVVKNLITSNEALIRAVDEEGLYPGFTGQSILAAARRHVTHAPCVCVLRFVRQDGQELTDAECSQRYIGVH